MRILGIETSCDETSAAILETQKQHPRILVRANVVASSLALHATTGGIIPEVAAREQIKCIIPVIDQAFKEAKLPQDAASIDTVAVTEGPGLIGSLLVGVETAKALAYVWNKPIIPVNHLVGHIYANWIDNTDIHFPALALIVSGGHTDLVFMKDHGKITWLGGTRDDAAGEAFDKIGRLLNLPYPAGPTIAKLAEKGDPKTFRLPRPMLDSNDFDFSFSGLKTAALREIKALGSKTYDGGVLADLSASVQQAIVDVLVAKTIAAAKKHKAKSILLGGGVAANIVLRRQMNIKIENLKLNIGLFVPPASLCTDNGSMIAAAAFFNNTPRALEQITANPQLHF